MIRKLRFHDLGMALLCSMQVSCLPDWRVASKVEDPYPCGNGEVFDTDAPLTPDLVTKYECGLGCGHWTLVIPSGVCDGHWDSNGQIDLGEGHLTGSGGLRAVDWLMNCDESGCTVDMDPRAAGSTCLYYGCKVHSGYCYDTDVQGPSELCETPGITDEFVDACIRGLGDREPNLFESYEELMLAIMTACPGQDYSAIHFDLPDCDLYAVDHGALGMPEEITDTDADEQCGISVSAEDGQLLGPQFSVAPDSSTLTLSHAGWDYPGFYTIPLRGSLFMTDPHQGPMRFHAGILSGQTMLGYETPWAAFNDPLEVAIDPKARTFTVSASHARQFSRVLSLRGSFLDVA